MAAFARISQGEIIEVGKPPPVYGSGTRWWEPREMTPEELAAHGWREVMPTTKPEETETTKYVDSVEMNENGDPVQVWNLVDRTPEEVTIYNRELNEAVIQEAVRQALNNLNLIISGATTYIDLSSPTQAQIAAQVKDNARAIRELARNQKQIIRLLVKELDATN